MYIFNRLVGATGEKEGFISADESAKFLGIKKSTLYAWKSRGLIPCYKPTGDKGLLFFKRSELREFIERGRVDHEHSL